MDYITLQASLRWQFFCIFFKVGGTASFGRGVDPEGNTVYALNVRCLDDVDIASLTIHKYKPREYSRGLYFTGFFTQGRRLVELSTDYHHGIQAS